MFKTITYAPTNTIQWQTVINKPFSFDDPIHDKQEGRFYHGYYRNYCYLPLYCFCGNIPLGAELRSSDRDGAKGTVEALEKIVPAIRKRFGKKVEIVVRADGGFAREDILAWCEQAQIKYCLGLPRNQRLQEEAEQAFKELEEQIDSGNFRPIRKYKDFEYKTLKSWTRRRRVVGKAELLGKGRNPRFIVTNFTSEAYRAQELYEEFYCARGDMENRIKEQQMDLFADRTSSSHFKTNQMRLWFSVFAHLMVEQLPTHLHSVVQCQPSPRPAQASPRSTFHLEEAVSPNQPPRKQSGSVKRVPH